MHLIISSESDFPCSSQLAAKIAACPSRIRPSVKEIFNTSIESAHLVRNFYKMGIFWIIHPSQKVALRRSGDAQ
jgi:hypothetical protein